MHISPAYCASFMIVHGMVVHDLSSYGLTVAEGMWCCMCS